MCQKIEKGMDIGKAVPVDVLSEDVFNAVQSCDSKREDETSANPPSVAMVTGPTAVDEIRRAKLQEHLESEETSDRLLLLENYHDWFSLMETQVMPYLESKLPDAYYLQYDRKWQSY